MARPALTIFQPDNYHDGEIHCSNLFGQKKRMESGG